MHFFFSGFCSHRLDGYLLFSLDYMCTQRMLEEQLQVRLTLLIFVHVCYQALQNKFF